ncbi:MAG: two-component system phosphate regulon sensor histidine kinase PhoR [Akkermansiaceae bacterium]|jgi:two-component system phosphate regulon sensor histidine kinase PhoR
MTYFAVACALVLLILLSRTKKKLRRSEELAEQLQQDLRTQADEQRKVHEREIQRLLNALPYAFFSINERGRIVRFNREAQIIFKNREILGRSIRQIFLDAPIVEEIEKVIEEASPHRYNLRLPPDSAFSKKSGEKDSHWEIDLRQLSIKSDSFEIQLMMRDITASVQADQIRQDFVANASHELRTPLSIIFGYLENLTEEGGLDKKEVAQKMLSTMDRHVVRINRIVEDMLLISKLESEDAAPLKLASFDLAHCVRDVSERLELVIKKQQATLVNEVPKLQVIGDQFYWTQVIFNLVENALKQNATLPVTVTVLARTQKNEDLVVEISDDGIGIPSADIPFIFKRFYRVEKHHSQTQIKGTGLGLSIVKRAIEAHGGKIAVTSTPGVNTTFTISIPKDPPAKEAPLGSP